MTRGARADELAVRPVRAGDATALVRCVERCYGASYPNPAFYDAAALRSMIESGDHGGAVALDGGVLIGHIAMRPAARGSSVVEAGTTIVDPAHRGRGVMGLLAAEIVRQCREHGIDGFVHFPTTAHTVMQRVSIAEGGRETGVLIGYIPAQTADLAIERAAAGRLAVTVVYQPISAAPAQTLFVPGRYERLLLTMAAELGLERRWVRPGRPAAGPTEIKQSTDGARSLERAAVDQIGADIAVIAGTLVALERDLVHVDLPMSDPALDQATEALVAAGFVFGAWLPGWAGHDVLRMQRVSHELGSDRPTLHSVSAAAIMRMIEADTTAQRSAEAGGY